MGPVNAPPKEDNKISEQQILKEAQAFITSNDICKKEDDCYMWIRLVLAKINLYGHKVLLEQLKRCPDRTTKMRYLEQWRSITFENLDLLFQNLIKSKMTKVEEATKLIRISTHDKYAQSQAVQLQRLYERGENLIKRKKVAVVIFVGASSTKSEILWDKQFHKQSSQQKCLFEIIMQRLEEIGDRVEFPTTYIFYDKFNSDKVNRFIKNYKYGDKLHCCTQNNHPVLNLNGSVCLKSKDSGEIIQMPNGSGDFYHASVKGMSILQKLRQQNVEYVNCINCENMLEAVLDPYLVGLFDVNKDDYDLMYKCTYPENQNQRIFKRIILEKGVPKADTIPNLTNVSSSYNKFSSENNLTIRQSPVWMGHVIFSIDKVSKVLKSAESMSYFPQAVNYKLKQINYWSPIDQKMRQNEVCYVFDKDLSDLLLNNLFKSKGIMVEREEQYLPVVTENGDYSWQQAYKQYEVKRKKQKGPFWERLQPHMMQSMIRNNQYEHNRPN